MKRPKRMTPELSETMAVMHHDGDTAVDIAKLFRLNPRTVRAAIASVAEEDIRAIRRILAMRLMSKHHEVADKAMSELLHRNLGETRDDGSNVVSVGQLSRLADMATSNQSALAKDAGMEETAAGGGTNNPLAELLTNQAELERAASKLPPGARVTLRQEVELGSAPASSPPSPMADLLDVTVDGSDEAE
ncbi:MAG: hypothetical protein GY838_13480 [bacterium]|nr:hypothetical protein [bacterium]